MGSFPRTARTTAAVLLLLCVCASCQRKDAGGDSSGGDVTSTGTSSALGALTTIQGTAAAGAPLANAAVYLRDARGAQRASVTDASGRFTADVSDFTAPVLMKVAASPGGDLFGVAMQSGVANLHPYTDLLLKGWYRVRGYDIALEFDKAGVIAMPAKPEIDALEAGLRQVIASWLRPFRVDPAAFNLITSPFDADGGGFDGLLHVIRADQSGGIVKLYPVDPNTSTAYNFIPILSLPTGSDLAASVQTASAGVLRTLTSWKDTLNAKGAAITVDALLPLYSTQYRNDGAGAVQDVANLILLVKDDPVTSVTLRDIITLDAVNGIAAVTWNMASASGATRTVPSSADRYFTSVFILDANTGAWLFHGNQRDVRVQFHAGVRRQDLASAPGSPVVSPIIDSIVTAAAGSVTSVYVNGPNLSANPIFFVKTTDGVRDAFSFPWDKPLTSAPLAGSVYTMRINMPGRVVTLDHIVKSGTGETFRITTPAGHALADAKLGAPLSVGWTIPAAFSSVYTLLTGSVMDGTPRNYIASSVEIEPPASEGTITLPVPGGAPVKAWVQVNMEGEHGEYSVSQKEFGN